MRMSTVQAFEFVENEGADRCLQNERLGDIDGDKDGNDGGGDDDKWEQWVPMDKQLFACMRHIQLCMLQKVDEMLNGAQISYWISGGSLIGAIRHQGFIPHDDDVDIECLLEDIEKLEAVPLDPPLYTGFLPPSQCGKWEGHPVAKLQFLNGKFEVDVFPRSKKDMEEKNPRFPATEEVFPLTRYKFHNIKVWGPGEDRCGAYLDRLYGKDWLDFVCVWNHDFNWYHGASFNPRKRVLPLDKYNAIVERSGVIPPEAEASSAATFQQLLEFDGRNLDHYLGLYEKYRFGRTRRRNQADAEWRETRKAASGTMLE